MSVAAEVRRFIRTELLVGAHVEGDPFTTQLLDSLAVEQLVAFLEERYGIRFEDHEVVAENFASVGAVTALVTAKRRRARGAR
jgi:acyl carrier protein